MLRDLVSAVEQPRDEQLIRIAPTQNHARPLRRRNQTHEIAALLFVHRRSFPDLDLRWWLGKFCRRTSLHHIRIIHAAAASGATSAAGASAPASSATADNIADIEDWSVEAIGGKHVAIAVRDRTRRIDHARLQKISDRAQA